LATPPVEIDDVVGEAEGGSFEGPGDRYVHGLPLEMEMGDSFLQIAREYVPTTVV